MIEHLVVITGDFNVMFNTRLWKCSELKSSSQPTWDLPMVTAGICCHRSESHPCCRWAVRGIRTRPGSCCLTWTFEIRKAGIWSPYMDSTTASLNLGILLCSPMRDVNVWRNWWGWFPLKSLKHAHHTVQSYRNVSQLYNNTVALRALHTPSTAAYAFPPLWCCGYIYMWQPASRH